MHSYLWSNELSFSDVVYRRSTQKRPKKKNIETTSRSINASKTTVEKVDGWAKLWCVKCIWKSTLDSFFSHSNLTSFYWEQNRHQASNLAFNVWVFFSFSLLFNKLLPNILSSNSNELREQKRKYVLVIKKDRFFFWFCFVWCWRVRWGVEVKGNSKVFAKTFHLMTVKFISELNSRDFSLSWFNWDPK